LQAKPRHISGLNFAPGGDFEALAPGLSSRAKWQRYDSPFRHVLASGVFTDTAYARIESAYQDLLGKATSRNRDYDAHILRIDEAAAEKIAPLLSLPFLSLVQRSLELDAEAKLDAAIHYHPGGSRAGWSHNDFNPGRFPREAVQDRIFSNASNVEYRVRAGEPQSGNGLIYMRKIAAIFYVANPDWSPDHGGETGLYWNGGAGARLVKRIPPVNNSLLLFECSPHSFHGFLGTSRPRGSIVFWLHVPLEDAMSRWPGAQPVCWP